MDTLSSDEEQLKKLKKWVQENGLSIVMGIVLGLGGVYGWRWFKDYRAEQAQLLSLQLTEINNQIDQKQYEAATIAAQSLASDSAGTLHAQMALLLAARARVEQGLFDKAAENLSQLIQDHPDSPFLHTATIRLSRIYIAQSKPEQASALIPEFLPLSYTRDYEELRGDIARVQGKTEEARSAYDRAINAAVLTDDVEFIRMKRESLAALETSKQTGAN